MKMMKEAASMQKEMKKIQKQLAKEKVEAVDGAVTVVARCDMSIAEVKIDSEAATPDKLERQVTTAVNGALTAAKKKAGSAMSQMGGGMGGLADMLG